MAIDISRDTLIAISDVPQKLKKHIGKKPHMASIYRWIGKGLHGVKLETIAIGGSQFTTDPALNEFFREVAIAKRSRHSAAVKTGMRRANLARQQSIEREADQLGI